MTRSHRLFRALLSLGLPQAGQLEFLRACLLSGAACEEAWQRWLGTGAGDELLVTGAQQQTRSSLQMLGYNLARNQVLVERKLQAVLRAAQMREELRTSAYERIQSDVLTALAGASIPVITLDGTALASTVYARSSLRHSHAVALLVQPSDFFRAREICCASGYAVLDSTRVGAKLQHSTGTGLRLLTSPMPGHLPRGAVAALWSRASQTTLVGVPCRTLSPADSLVLVCSDAALYPAGDQQQRLADAYLLVTRSSNLDWAAVSAAAHSLLVSLLVADLLAYLSRHLDAPVPASMLNALDQQAAAETADFHASQLANELVLQFGAPKILRSLPSWHLRLDLLSSALAPLSISLPQRLFIAAPRVISYVARGLRWRFSARTRRRQQQRHSTGQSDAY